MFAENLIQLRKLNQMSQDELADRCVETDTLEI